MPTPSDDYDTFVTEQLPDLLTVAELLTAQPSVAESLVVDTLVATYRAWPSLQRSRDPVSTVRRLLSSQYSGWARAQNEARSGTRRHEPLQLHEHPAPREQLDDTDAVWQAILDLPVRERTALVWRWLEGCENSAAASAAPPRRPSVAHIARDAAHHRAFESIAATVGISPDDEISDGRSNSRDWLEGEIAATLAARRRPHLDVASTRAKVGTQTDQINATPRRASSAVLAVAAAAVVVVALVVVQMWPGGPAGDGAAGSTPPWVAPAPTGAQLVGYGDVAVAVPSSWGPKTACAAGVDDAVIYGDAVTRRSCASEAGVSSVTFEAPPAYPPLFRKPPEAISVVGEHQVLAFDLGKAAGLYERVVLAPISGFQMTIRSPDRGVVDEIVASIRGIPVGYAVVPLCEGHRVGDAVADLTVVGLRPTIAHASGVSQRYGSPPVTFQSPAPGSIVLRGTKVRLGLPSF
ncbi:MAG: PASTA domain-containing protein [Nocardioidaceae bacterium]